MAIQLIKNQESGSKSKALLNDNSHTSRPLALQTSKSAPTLTLTTQLRFGKQGHTTPSSSVPFAPHKGRRCAFTLAEVLITLGIIGVVAAMTLPTLIQKYQEKETVTKLKKMYSVLSQAYMLYLQDNPPEQYDTTEEGAIASFNIFKPYLKVMKDCGTGTGEGCIYTEPYSKKNGAYHFPYTVEYYYKVLLSDGASIWFKGEGADGIVIFYDVNGVKSPNQWGHDLFDFVIIGNRLFANGTPNSKNYFDVDCAPSNAFGFGCTAWVIQNENLDYLHCDDLSWNGKTKCK